MRYFIELSFEGTRYSGWQVQENARTVQQVLDEALGSQAGRPVNTTGCCRTDAGVHARQLFAHFDAESEITDAYRFLHQLNGILPGDVAVHGVHRVPDEAHARFDATSRTYTYVACRKKNPFLRDFAAGFYFDLDVDRINEVCAGLARYSDFRCFARNNSDARHTLCDVSQARWTYENGIHRFTITANRFLRGMVRALAGTLVEVGRGQLSAADFDELVRHGNRSDAGASVPARGLYLTEVTYPFLTGTPRGGIPIPVELH